MREKSILSILEKIFLAFEFIYGIIIVLIIFGNDKVFEFFLGSYTKSLPNNILVSIRVNNLFLGMCLICILHMSLKKNNKIRVLKEIFVCSIISQIIVSIINVLVCLIIGNYFDNNELLFLLVDVIYVSIYSSIMERILSRKGLSFKEENDKKEGFSVGSLIYIIVIACILSIIINNNVFDYIISVVVIIYIILMIIEKLGYRIFDNETKVQNNPIKENSPQTIIHNVDNENE